MSAHDFDPEYPDWDVMMVIWDRAEEAGILGVRRMRAGQDRFSSALEGLNQSCSRHRELAEALTREAWDLEVRSCVALLAVNDGEKPLWWASRAMDAVTGFYDKAVTELRAK